MHPPFVIPSSHTWTPAGAVVHARTYLRGRKLWKQVNIDFRNLAIARGGLLQSAIRARICPVNYPDIRSFVQGALHGTVNQHLIRNIPSTPENPPTTQDIRLLYSLIEDRIFLINGASQLARSIRIRKLFENARTQLCEGRRIEEVSVTSRFKPTQRTGKPCKRR